MDFLRFLQKMWNCLTAGDRSFAAKIAVLTACMSARVRGSVLYPPYNSTLWAGTLTERLYPLTRAVGRTYGTTPGGEYACWRTNLVFRGMKRFDIQNPGSVT